MPIKIGNEKTLAAFGSGDIGLTTGHQIDDPNVRTLVFFQHEAKPREKWDNEPTLKSNLEEELPKPIIRMTFTDKRSVRVLISMAP